MQRQRNFPILHMSCAACATRVDRLLNEADGVTSATVNYASSMANITYDDAQTSPERLRSILVNAGYDLVVGEDDRTNLTEAERAQQRHFSALKKNCIGAWLLSIPVMVLSMGFMEWEWTPWISWVLATPVVFYMGRSFFINAWKQLLQGTSNMDSLVALSTGIAYLFSVFNLFFPAFWQEKGLHAHVYFEAATMIIAFILLGRWLEERAKGNTSSAIRKLMGLQPDTVTRIGEDGKETTVLISEVQVGDRLRTKPGERIAVDGVVIEGTSYVDESMLTGEPAAVRKESGSSVFAGTMNQKGSFVFTAQKVGADTTLARIIQMVQSAQGSKAPVQKLVDKIASIFVPSIMLIAVLTFFIWWTVGGDNGFTHGLLAAVTVLIIACPCALGLATPTAVMVGIGKGAEWGILVKDAESLELAKKIDAVVLDKTGTITEGHPTVTDAHWEEENKTLVAVLKSMEIRSDHPLATAITEHLTDKEATELSSFQNIAGKGLQATTADGSIYRVGNHRFMEDRITKLSTALQERVAQWEREQKTIVYFAQDHEVKAVFAIADAIKASSLKAIAELQKMGVEVHILTGDNQATAQAVAAACGVEHYVAEVLPEEKASYVQSLQMQGKCVAMVGDGINDSAALAQADVSMAMGCGSDIAMDVAKLTLMQSDLQKVSQAIRLSRETVKVIRQNLFWAFIYNLIGVPIAAGILYPVCGFLLDPMWAGAAMAMSSVSVVTNSLRLRHQSSAVLPTEVKEETVTSSATITKQYVVDGMMCQHCRASVEKALQSIEGATVELTLEPPVARITFTDAPLTVEELQAILTEKAGDYQIREEA